MRHTRQQLACKLNSSHALYPQIAGAMTETHTGSTNWVSLWEQLLSALGSAGGSDDAAADRQREWHELGVFLAQQAAATLPGLTQAAMVPWEAFAGIFAPAGPGSEAPAQAPQALSLPPIGLFHPDQESIKRLQRASTAFNDLYQQYNAQLSGVLDDTLRALSERVKDARSRGKRIDSARELYDLWVAAGETCFAKVARDPGFCALQAQVLNAQSELRQSQQAVMELWLKQWGLPTRSDVEALQAQLASLRSRIDIATANAAPQPARTAESRSPAKSSRPAPTPKPRRRAGAAGR